MFFFPEEYPKLNKQLLEYLFGSEHFVTESNLLKRLFCFLFSPLLYSRRGITPITVEHPSGEGGDTAVRMEYGMNTLVALSGGCSQSLFFSFLSNGTSMISLIIPPKDQISRVAKMLADEFGTASNIKSRVNRLSVLGAITSVQQRLKLYNKGNL